MIRELSREEIKGKEAYIESLRGQEKYRFYFSQEEVNEPERAWVDGGYYIDLTKYNGDYYLGVIKLSEEPCGFGFIALIRKLLKEYREILLWCYRENKESMKFHRLLCKKFKVKRYMNEQVSLVIVREGEK